jgi:hypothetical protein
VESGSWPVAATGGTVWVSAMAISPQRVGGGLLDRVASTPSSPVIVLLSTTNGSSNWYCISTSSHRGVDESRRAQDDWWETPEPCARSARVAVHQIDELPGGADVRVVGQVARLAGRVGVFAENGEALTDVRDVGVAVRLVGVAEHRGGPAGEGGVKRRSPRSDRAPPRGPK